MSNSISLDTLKTLTEASSVREFLVVPFRGGWCVRVRWGNQEKPLRSQREPVRVFHTTDTAMKLLKKVGAQTVTVVLA